MIRWVLCLLGCGLLSGCGLSVDQDGWIGANAVEVEQCELDSPFELDIDFYAFSACNDTVQLRLQHGGKPMIESDGVSMQFSGWPNLDESLDAGEVTLELPDPDVIVEIYLNRSCSQDYVSLAVSAGTLRIRRLDPKDGGHLEMDGLWTLVNPQDQTIAARDVQFEAEGEFLVATPHKDFSICP